MVSNPRSDPSDLIRSIPLAVLAAILACPNIFCSGGLLVVPVE